MKNDRQLQNDILAELDRDPSIPKGTIGAEVHHGTVKLSGRVSSDAIKKSAENGVRRVADVKTLIMDIDIRPAGTVPGLRTPRSVGRIPEIA
jgi:osmotically-inducible protein OsmY